MSEVPLQDPQPEDGLKGLYPQLAGVPEDPLPTVQQGPPLQEP
ncbi:protein of unknown function [Candidatus Hydrogenisulfobacillus filiaventi]|uniref:Uncharacterized protein n=1 Tax=Candidatus Hydrogenisulfobacillus filiaventi TaxID=2707344 RepID=A0A6F8ZHZ4_9FIRM|nr:protein of unknown function [Candidatus Hydrogenisulfobacillus filiaventi]